MHLLPSSSPLWLQTACLCGLLYYPCLFPIACLPHLLCFPNVFQAYAADRVNLLLSQVHFFVSSNGFLGWWLLE